LSILQQLVILDCWSDRTLSNPTECAMTRKGKLLMWNLKSATLNEWQSLNATAPSFCCKVRWPGLCTLERHTEVRTGFCVYTHTHTHTHTICYDCLSLIKNDMALQCLTHTPTVSSFINIHSTVSVMLNVCRWLEKLSDCGILVGILQGCEY
jgi:hypothetical protein